MSTAQVLIVGAGPSGLLTACTLARHGIQARVIERQRHRSVHSKALAVHARTLEVLDNLGVVAPFLERGQRVHGFNAFANGKRLVHLGFDELQTPYPYILSLPQSETEEILETRAMELGVRVEREVTLETLEVRDDGASAGVRHQDGREERIDSAWVVGCDGAHSRVRDLLDIPYVGEDIDAPFVLADVDVEWDWTHDEAYVFFSPKGTLAFIPLPSPPARTSAPEVGRSTPWRLIASLPSGHPPEDATLDFFQRLVEQRCHVQMQLSNPKWLAGFSIRQRKVAKLTHGRVHLVGDAAHCHSPVGGQGMNVGLQDAYNLGWKLALHIQGKARRSVLESYQEEREPVAAALLRGTSAATRVVTLRHPVPQRLRDMLASTVGELEVVQARMARTLGELSLSYHDSPIVDEHRTSLLLTNVSEDRSVETPWVGDWRDFAAAPRPGDRAPDASLLKGSLFDLFRHEKHTLLLFDGKAHTQAGYDLLTDIATMVKRHFDAVVAVQVVTPLDHRPEGLAWEGPLAFDTEGHAHHAYGAGAECLYLIRPDGYIGFRSQPADKDRLRTYLESIFLT